MEEMVRKAHQQGAAAGQISLSMFILEKYGDQIPSTLKHVLEKTSQDGFSVVGEITNSPPEDVALRVQEIMKKTLT